jgi:hypothetical protein
MQRFHTSRREKNNLAPKQHRLQQRRESNSLTNPSPSTSRNTLSPASRSAASEHTLDSELPTNDWPFNTSSFLFSDELSRSPTQQSHEAPVGALIPTSRLYDMSNQRPFHTSM